MVSFSGLNLKNTVFEGCEILECDFIQTDLSEVDFENSDLRGSRFQNCNLSLTSFKTAVNYSIDPNENALKKTKFSMPEVIGLLDAYDLEIE